MLLSMLFDDDDETAVTALFQVGDQVLQLKQKPSEGRLYDKSKEDRQEYAMAHPDEDYQPSSANGEYDSAFPNVGLVIWQSGFVLADYLLRRQPLGPWNRPLSVLELGCGTGQLGIVLALAGADVTLTDLEHITPLTQVNVELNSARCNVQPKVVPYMWGKDIAAIQTATAQQCHQVQDHDVEQQQEVTALQVLVQQPWDVIVAADVLYEPQHYDELLISLSQLCTAAPSSAPPPATAGASARGQRPLAGSHQLQHEQGQGQVNASSGIWKAPLIYICYRVRQYGEHGFESKAVKCGFEVSAVLTEELHVDYRCGGYRLIHLTKKPVT